MTPSQDRLDRIEALLEVSLAQHHQEMEEIRAGLRETKAITESNARAIEAWSSRIGEAEEASRSRVENTDRRLEAAIADTVAMVADMGRQQQETDQRFEVFLQEARADRQRIDNTLAEQREMAQRFEVFLEDSRADRQSFDQMMAANATEHGEINQRFEVSLQEARADRQRIDNTLAEQREMAQRFEVFLEDSRADRQSFDQSMAANAAEHRAFTQNVQVLLAEIARLWQRVAG